MAVAVLVRWCLGGVGGCGRMMGRGLGGGGLGLSPSGYVIPLVGLLIFGLLGRLAGLWYLWW